ncbi:hypothetical protein CHCC20335_0687 [Bacillus paralicheniformis]|nr:hypothetical protein CHCC20335_0687 [Bacillus paralicheniformis]
MRFVLNAIRSTLAVRNSLLPMVVLIALTKNTVLSNNRYYQQAGMFSCLFFTCHKSLERG